MTNKSALVSAGVVGVGAIALGIWEYVLQVPMAQSGLGESDRAAIELMVLANQGVTTIATIVFGGFGVVVLRALQAMRPWQILGALVILEVLASSLVAGLILNRHLAFLLINDLKALNDRHIWAVFNLQIFLLIVGAVMFIVYGAFILASSKAMQPVSPK